MTVLDVLALHPSPSKYFSFASFYCNPWAKDDSSTNGPILSGLHDVSAPLPLVLTTVKQSVPIMKSTPTMHSVVWQEDWSLPHLKVRWLSMMKGWMEGRRGVRSDNRLKEEDRIGRSDLGKVQ